MPKPLEPTGLDHVVLNCRDIGVAKDFYAGILGMTVVHESATYLFLNCGEQTLALFRTAAGLPSKRLEMDHVAFTVRQSFEETVARLKDHGITAETRPSDPHCIYFNDPDGHRIQVLAGT
ncbi:MAG: VOC family protein [Alphaproteobacteria bacterium]|nr:VOC family protein [Alphaproteobacteria bacterium]